MEELIDDYRKKVDGKWRYKVPDTNEWLSPQQMRYWLHHHNMTPQQYYDTYN